jgi:hypothetical protein
MSNEIFDRFKNLDKPGATSSTLKAANVVAAETTAAPAETVEPTATPVAPAAGEPAHYQHAARLDSPAQRAIDDALAAAKATAAATPVEPATAAQKISQQVEAAIAETAAKAAAASRIAPNKSGVPASMMTPEMVAFLEQQQQTTAASVTAAVTAIMSQFAPILASLKDPSPKEKREQEQIDRNIAQAKRLKEQGQEADKQNRTNLEKMRAACPHIDQSRQEAIRLVHNQFDGQPRGLCMKCGDWISPCHYSIDGPIDAKTGQVAPFVVPEHKDYFRVRALVAQQGIQG